MNQAALNRRRSMLRCVLNQLDHPIRGRTVGSLSCVVGLLCYALSSSFKSLFGEWNPTKIILYIIFSSIFNVAVFFAPKIQESVVDMLKPHVKFLVLMLSSLYSFFADRSREGKPNIWSVVSSVAFALTFLCLSRQMKPGFDVGLFGFFLGYVTGQLMKIQLIFILVAAVFCYPLVVLGSHPESQSENRDTSVEESLVLRTDVGDDAGKRMTSGFRYHALVFWSNFGKWLRRPKVPATEQLLDPQERESQQLLPLQHQEPPRHQEQLQPPKRHQEQLPPPHQKQLQPAHQELPLQQHQEQPQLPHQEEPPHQKQLQPPHQELPPQRHQEQSQLSHPEQPPLPHQKQLQPSHQELPPQRHQEQPLLLHQEQLQSPHQEQPPQRHQEQLPPSHQEQLEPPHQQPLLQQHQEQLSSLHEEQLPQLHQEQPLRQHQEQLSQLQQERPQQPLLQQQERPRRAMPSWQRLVHRPRPPPPPQQLRPLRKQLSRFMPLKRNN